MSRQEKPAWEQIKSYLWLLLMMEYVIFFLCIIFGRSVGYKNTFVASSLLGFFIVICFIAVILLNGIGIFIYNVFHWLKRIIFKGEMLWPTQRII